MFEFINNSKRSSFGKSSIFDSSDDEFYKADTQKTIEFLIRNSGEDVLFSPKEYMTTYYTQSYKYVGKTSNGVVETYKLDIKVAVNKTLKGGEKLRIAYDECIFTLPETSHHRTYTVYIPIYSPLSQTSGEIEYGVKIASDSIHDFYWLMCWLFPSKAVEIYNRFSNQILAKLTGEKSIKKIAQWYEKTDVWIIVGVKKDIRIEHLKQILSQRTFVNEWGINEEKAVLNIIMSFSPTFVKKDDIQNISVNKLKETDSTYFLTKIAETFIGKKTLFEVMYGKMNDYGGADSFSKMIKTLYIMWLYSEYVNPALEVYKNYSAPENIPYNSKKGFLYYESNFVFEFTDKFDITAIEIQKKREMRPFRGGGVMGEKVEEKRYGRYHTYYPLMGIGKVEKTEMILPECMIPIFMLKAANDKNSWANFEQSVILSIDIITTLSGVGNLYKLRHLAKLATQTEKILVILGSIQVATGATGIMLNFVDENKYPEFCTKLRTVLLLIDLATLGGEVVSRKALSQASREALDAAPDALRQEKRWAEVEKELERLSGKYVAESFGSLKFITKAKYLDKTALLGDVSKAEKKIIDEAVEYGVFVDSKGHIISDFFSDGLAKGLNIPTRIELITQKFSRIFIHNHPTNTPLSAHDIMTFVSGNLQELRAVCKNGDVYAIIKKGDLPSLGKGWDNILKRVVTRVKTENAGLLQKANSTPPGSSERLLLDQKIADIWIDELGNLIEYVKYK